MEKREFFPLFIRTRGKHVVVFGGGAIAARRINTLRRFHFQITVVAPRIRQELLVDNEDITIITDTYHCKYLSEADLVLACTDDKEVNRQIHIDAQQKNILVNVCDRKEDCDFYFPGIVFAEEATLGIVGNGKNHHGIKIMIDKIRNMFEGDRCGN